MFGGFAGNRKIIFCWSKLQSVVMGLLNLVKGQQINNKKEDFIWCVNLFGRIDWDSEHYKKGEFPEMCMIATQLRPLFYGGLLRLKIPFNDEFSERLYKTLESSGIEVYLSSQELNQIQSLFYDISQKMLVGLQKGGCI